MQKVRIFHLQNVGWENFEISILLVTLLYRKQRNPCNNLYSNTLHQIIEIKKEMFPTRNPAIKSGISYF